MFQKYEVVFHSKVGVDQPALGRESKVIRGEFSEEHGRGCVVLAPHHVSTHLLHAAGAVCCETARLQLHFPHGDLVGTRCRRVLELDEMLVGPGLHAVLLEPALDLQGQGLVVIRACLMAHFGELSVCGEGTTQ